MKKSKDSLLAQNKYIDQETGSARLGENSAEGGPAWACMTSSCYCD